MVCTLCAGLLNTVLHSELHSELHIVFTVEHNSLGCLIMSHERVLHTVAAQEHYITVITDTPSLYVAFLLVSFPGHSHHPVFDSLQYAKMEGEGLVHFIM